MLTIKCKVNGNPFRTILYQYISKDNVNQETKNLANAIWERLMNDESVTELQGLMPDGSVLMPKKDVKMAYAIKVKFDGYDKIYTYPSVFPANENDLLVVHTPRGFGLPKVFESCKVPVCALPALCKAKDESHLNWAIGVLGEYKL